MKTDWQQISIDVHNLIRAGQTDNAVQILQKINTSQIPREFALELAALARRAGIFSQALRILRPIVVTEAASAKSNASPAEVGEYSFSLFKSGCVFEALRWLDSIRGEEVGEAELYRGYAHIMEWDYAKAVGPLKSFISKTPDSFTKLVAKVNLSAALINTENLKEAEELIHLNIEEAGQYNNLRLKANSYELLSQIAFKNLDYTKASAYLDKAWQILSIDNSMDQLFLIKWRAILDAAKSHDIGRLTAAREAARSRHHFETLRDLDFYALKVEFSNATFAKLFCGTPYPAYRERLNTEFSKQHDSKLMWPECLIGEGNQPVLDVESMAVENRLLDPTPQLHQTFVAIWADLYRPRSVGSVFEKIFQGEYYDPNTSPNRVHRLMARLRAWLKSRDIPVQIDFENGGFVGHLQPGLQLRLSVGEAFHENRKDQLKWNRAEVLLSGSSDFSAEDLAEKLAQNHSSATRLLKWAVANNKVIKKGAGRGSRYSLLKP